jgi:hypothetical protein
VTPITVGSAAVDNWFMMQLTIRCHPCVPVSTDELEQWLEQQVNEIRAESPQGTVRLSRLTQGLPNVDIDIGWLVELELPDGQPLLTGDRLAATLRDMRLLGLQPTLLAPVQSSDWSAGKTIMPSPPPGSGSDPTWADVARELAQYDATS